MPGLYKGTRLLIWFAENISPDSYSGNNTFVIDMDDVRQEIRDCIYSQCGFTVAERTIVCNLWSSRNFPGELCPPPVPEAPNWILLVYTGECGYGYSYPYTVYGSVLYPTWPDVSHETSYQLCWSIGLAGPFQCIQTFAQNSKNSLPSLFVASGNPFVGIRGCNSSGCGQMAVTEAIDSCNEG